jgi:hypothetical protein
LILDNQQTAMVEDVNARTYRPRFVIDESGVMEYSDRPSLVSGTQQSSAGRHDRGTTGSMTASK